jgi:WG repeat protein
MVPTRLSLIAFSALAACYQALGCSWDYPVWPKSKRSDTPLFRFVVNEHYGVGYIDRHGRIVIQPQYLVFGNHGGDFFEGLANVTTKGEGDFHIDANGKRVARSNYLATGDFAEGFATRWFPSERKYGYINREGATAIPATFEVAGSFSEGLAAVEVRGRYGYIDHSGNVIIPARFAYAEGFSDGHALVIESGPCQRIGYGPCEYPLNPPYTIPDGAKTPSGQLPRCRYSVIDKKGTLVFSMSYIDAKPFADG